MLGGWDVLRHSATDLLNSRPYLPPNFVVRFDRHLLIAMSDASNLFSRLCHAELVCRQLGRVHPIKYFFLLGDSLLRLNRIAPATVKPFVSGIVEHAEHAVLDPGLAGDARKHLELFGGVGAKLQAFAVWQADR